MKLRMTVVALIVAALPAAGFAQSSSRIDERQAEQKQRIEQGVKSGELTRKEAERLRQGQARIQAMQDRAMADGRMTKDERRRIEQAQDEEAKKIWRERHDEQSAKSNSPSSIDQRQAEQQRRIDQGVRSGQLTKKEAARLQEGHARVQRMIDNARADGRITREERQRIESAQDRESERIRHERQDKQTAR